MYMYIDIYSRVGSEMTCKWLLYDNGHMHPSVMCILDNG